MTPGFQSGQTVTQVLPELRPLARNPAKTQRPTSRRRAELLATPAGQEMARAARESLGTALQSHGLASLAALRLQCGLSQKALSEACGLPQPHLSRLENGKVPNPDAATLEALALGLGVSVDKVLAAIRQGVQA
ncbi:MULTISPECIES: helix-turn-helix domain-containing protein [Giesbergeria]|uniref:Helix-turn-helix domain-containing protein n=1 Tax=Giesbergeria sinuosa TaxID=80883 RepID=A0ABV9QD50_9BURK